MDLTEKDKLLGVASDMLTGQLTRTSMVVTLRTAPLAYAAVTMTLAMRYKLNSDDELTEGLNSVFSDVVTKGNCIRPSQSGIYLREVASKMGLFRLGTRADNRLVTLTPSPRLVQLINKRRSHPAVSNFMEDMKADILRHDAQLARMGLTRAAQ